MASRVVGCPNVQLMSNVSDGAREPSGPGSYHTDLDYETVPATASMLLCRAAPRDGGFTSFLDMEQALAELPSEKDAKLAQKLGQLQPFVPVFP